MKNISKMTTLVRYKKNGTNCWHHEIDSSLLGWRVNEHAAKNCVAKQLCVNKCTSVFDCLLEQGSVWLGVQCVYVLLGFDKNKIY